MVDGPDIGAETIVDAPKVNKKKSEGDVKKKSSERSNKAAASETAGGREKGEKSSRSGKSDRQGDKKSSSSGRKNGGEEGAVKRSGSSKRGKPEKKPSGRKSEKSSRIGGGSRSDRQKSGKSKSSRENKKKGEAGVTGGKAAGAVTSTTSSAAPDDMSRARHLGFSLGRKRASIKVMPGPILMHIAQCLSREDQRSLFFVNRRFAALLAHASRVARHQHGAYRSILKNRGESGPAAFSLKRFFSLRKAKQPPPLSESAAEEPAPARPTPIHQELGQSSVQTDDRLRYTARVQHFEDEFRLPARVPGRKQVQFAGARFDVSRPYADTKVNLPAPPPPHISQLLAANEAASRGGCQTQ